MSEKPVAPVWKGTLDEKYICTVVRIGDESHQGILTVHRISDNKEMLRTNVGLSYGAQFGPDAFDIEEWCAQAEAAVIGDK